MHHVFDMYVYTIVYLSALCLEAIIVLHFLKMKNLCVFSSYSLNGFVHDYVLRLLNGIQNDLESDIVFVTTSPEFSGIQRNKVAEYVIESHVRENQAHDFGSYFYGLQQIEDWFKYENIFLINDSVYGPLYSLCECYERMSTAACDVWGITESHLEAYHLQSYFLCFKKSSFVALKKFIDDYSYPENYWDIVRQGEIGVSQFMLKSGLNLLSYVPQDRVLSSVISRKGLLAYLSKISKHDFKMFFNKFLMANVSTTFWYELVVSCRAPFIKTKVLRDREFYRIQMSTWAALDIPEDVKDAIHMHLAHVRNYAKYNIRSPWYKVLLNPLSLRRRFLLKRSIKSLESSLLD